MDDVQDCTHVEQIHEIHKDNENRESLKNQTQLWCPSAVFVRMRLAIIDLWALLVGVYQPRNAELRGEQYVKTQTLWDVAEPIYL